jgi:hypothetical protein
MPLLWLSARGYDVCLYVELLSKRLVCICPALALLHTVHVETMCRMTHT